MGEGGHLLEEGQGEMIGGQIVLFLCACMCVFARHVQTGLLAADILTWRWME